MRELVEDLPSLLARVLGPTPCPPHAYRDLASFRADWHAASAGWELPVDRAIVGGARADRLGYAFAAGYASALARLVPSLGAAQACLCVTEAGGAHPRALRTTLTREGEGWRLDGEKRWATLAGEGDLLLVAATVGREGDRSLLRLAVVPARSAGVTLTALPPTPFTPEIPHYGVRFDGVALAEDALLPGDGWTAYVKPFRTVEDVHVCAAATAWLLATAVGASWPADVAERLTALLLTLRALAAVPPESLGGHVALAGALTTLRALVSELDPLWDRSDPAVAARWRRDAPLLTVAAGARAARTRAAWESLTGGRAASP